MSLQSYRAWDPVVRWFHWINVLTVTGLIAVGTAILYSSEIGASTEGKILLKSVHVWIGYAFAANLLVRLVWAVIGPSSARFRAMLPMGRGYTDDLKRHIGELGSRNQRGFIGHTPLGRLAVTLLIVLLVVQAVTGLVLAGTDLYMFPFGSRIAEWVAAPGLDPAAVMPYDRATVDETAYAAMRSFRSPFVTTHYYAFYVLMVVIVLHIAGVVLAELKEGGALVSAMFTGRKLFEQRPVDAPTDDRT